MFHPIQATVVHVFVDQVRHYKKQMYQLVYHEWINDSQNLRNHYRKTITTKYTFSQGFTKRIYDHNPTHHFTTKYTFSQDVHNQIHIFTRIDGGMSTNHVTKEKTTTCWTSLTINDICYENKNEIFHNFPVLQGKTTINVFFRFFIFF